MGLMGFIVGCALLFWRKVLAGASLIHESIPPFLVVTLRAKPAPCVLDEGATWHDTPTLGCGFAGVLASPPTA